MSISARSLLALTVAGAWAVSGMSPALASPAPAASGHYDHVFVIVEENHGFTDVIGNPAAPNLNALASQYGVATSYYAVSHPSEPNYVALLGGSTFTVASDNAYYVNRVVAPSLISELDQAGISWKAYLQGLPHPGYQGICYPANCNGAPDKDPLYVSKHNAIANLTSSLNPADWSRQVPVQRLAADLRGGHVPAFNWVIPDECHDQHGDPPYCIDSGTPGGKDPQDQRLVAVGDQYLGQLVAEITGASFWAKGNNHYSLLQTIQRNFGLACLQNTCDTAKVKPLTPLFAVTGSAASAFKPLAVPEIAAPSPAPTEPVRYTTDRSASGGWAVQPAPALGAGDNTYGAVAAISPSDVWAVGNFLPDTPASNQDATLATAAHFDGKRWTQTPVPDSGPNVNTLFGDGSAWHIAATPKLDTQRDTLYSAVALSARDVWAVGHQQSQDGTYGTLIEHWDGARPGRLSSTCSAASGPRSSQPGSAPGSPTSPAWPIPAEPSGRSVRPWTRPAETSSLWSHAIAAPAGSRYPRRTPGRATRFSAG